MEHERREMGERHERLADDAGVSVVKGAGVQSRDRLCVPSPESEDHDPTMGGLHRAAIDTAHLGVCSGAYDMTALYA